MNLENTDNSDEIIEAIGNFKAKHNEPETEQAIPNWYEEYNEVLATANRANIEMRNRWESTAYLS